MYSETLLLYLTISALLTFSCPSFCSFLCLEVGLHIVDILSPCFTVVLSSLYWNHRCSILKAIKPNETGSNSYRLLPLVFHPQEHRTRRDRARVPIYWVLPLHRRSPCTTISKPQLIPFPPTSKASTTNTSIPTPPFSTSISRFSPH